MLDEICWRYYGSEQQMMAVLEANPGLVEWGEVYPAGLIITLPENAERGAAQPVSLWS